MTASETSETLGGIVAEFNAGTMTFNEMVRQVYILGSIDGNMAMLDAFDKLGESGMSFSEARVMCCLRLRQEMMSVIADLAPDDVECDA